MQTSRHVASLTIGPNIFCKPELTQREKIVNNIYKIVANIIGLLILMHFFVHTRPFSSLFITHCMFSSVAALLSTRI